MPSGKTSATAIAGLATQPVSHVFATTLTTASFAYLVGGIPPSVAVLLVLMFGILSAAQNSVNAWTDIIPDRMSWPKRPLAMGAVRLRQATSFSILLLLAGISLLVWILTIRSSPLVLLIMTIDIFLRVAYSTPPLRLKRYALLSNLIIASFAVSFPFAATVALSDRPNILVLPVAAILLFEAVATLVLEDFVTIEGDRTIGDVTLPLALGRAKAALISAGLFVGALVTALYSFAAQKSVLWLLVAAIILLQTRAALRLRFTTGRELRTYHLAGILVFLSGIILVVGFATGLV